ncbi:MAG: hypothetical protein JWR15_3007, partial [Prosthecobacter sp.]|nr:hypothetical protein [Prosthecobacter sp.]
TGVQAQLQKAQRELSESEAALSALKSEFDQFRIKRRSAMVGKEFPMLTLDEGKVLRDAVITAISADEVAIRHADGFIKVALANTSADLRWEACYDPDEARKMALETMLRKGREEQERLARQPNIPTLTRGSFDSARMAAEALRRQLASQRSAMNIEFQSLTARNPSLLKGNVWNSAQPEASPLLNSVSGSRAVLGLSRLQYGRDAILATLRDLRSIDPSAR